MPKDDDIKKITEKIEKSNRQFSGMVSFNDLFTSSFLTSHTQFSNFKDLLDQGNYHVNSVAEFNAILGPEFDKLIDKTTDFKSWQEMQVAAVDEYFKRKN